MKLSRAEYRRREKLKAKSVKIERSNRAQAVRKLKGDFRTDPAMLAEKGKADGRVLAFCFVAEALNELHGWEGKQLESFLEKCNNEAARSDDAGVRFVLSHIIEVSDYFMAQMKNINNGKNILENVYYVNRDTYFRSSMAVILTVLYSEYDWCSNKTHSGKLDRIAEEAVRRFEKMQGDCNMDSNRYADHMSEQTGLAMVKEQW